MTMRKLLLLLGLFAFLAMAERAFAFGGPVSSRQSITNNSSTSAPIALAPAGTYASSVTLIGNKTARTANTGTVYVGPTATNDAQPVSVTSGQTVTIVAPPGEWIDLNEWYLDVATANDGLVIIWTQ